MGSYSACKFDILFSICREAQSQFWWTKVYGSAIAWYPRYISSICLVFTYRKNASNGFLPYRYALPYLS